MNGRLKVLRGTQEDATLGLLALICAGYWLLFATSAPIRMPDSLSYLEFDPTRTAGYPIFLRLVGESAAGWMQPLLYALALLWLGREVLRMTRSPGLAAGVVLACMINPMVNQLHTLVLTESLFMSLSIAYLALMLRLLRKRHWRAAVAVSAVAGLAAAVRPTAYAYLPALVMLGWVVGRYGREHRVLLIAAASIPFVAICLVERFASSLHHGESTTSLAGRVLFGKAAMIGGTPAPSADANPHRRLLESALATRYGAVREILEKAPRWDVRQVLHIEYEECIFYQCSADLRAALPMSEPLKDRLLMQVGQAHLAANPIAYLLLTLNHYRSLWTLFQRSHPSAYPALQRFVAEHRPLPFEDKIRIPAATPVRAAVLVRPAVLLIGLLTLGLALTGIAWTFAARQPLAPELAAACLSALTMHASLLLTAALVVGIARYTLSMWPMMMLSVLLLAHLAWIRLPAGLGRIQVAPHPKRS